MTVGERIGNIAKEKGINLHKLSSLAVVPYNTIYSIVKRKSNRVDMDVLPQIATALGVRLFELLPEDIARLYKAGIEFGYNGSQFENKLYSRYFESIGYSGSRAEQKIISAFSSLNEEGQQKALERVEELTEIPKYQIEKAPSEDG